MHLTRWFLKLLRSLSKDQLLCGGPSGGSVAQTPSSFSQSDLVSPYAPPTHSSSPPQGLEGDFLMIPPVFKPPSLHWSFLGLLLVLNSFAKKWSLWLVLFTQAFIEYLLLCQALCFVILWKFKDNENPCPRGNAGLSGVPMSIEIRVHKEVNQTLSEAWEWSLQAGLLDWWCRAPVSTLPSGS